MAKLNFRLRERGPISATHQRLFHVWVEHSREIGQWYPCDTHEPAHPGTYMIRKRGMFPTSPFPLCYTYPASRTGRHHGAWYASIFALTPSTTLLRDAHLYEFCGLAQPFAVSECAPVCAPQQSYGDGIDPMVGAA